MNTEAYLENRKKFEEKIHQQWLTGIKAIFGDEIPASAEWNKQSEICEVLSKLTAPVYEPDEDGGHSQNNHTFYPDSGGNDLYGCQMSVEPGCVELDFSGDELAADIIKPVRLIFEKIDGNLDWSYFRIETDDLKAFSEDFPDSMYMESLKEENRGSYISPDSDEEIEGSFRYISRWVKAGAYLIVKKTSIYNDNPATYDARHNKMTAEEFKDYMLQNYNSFQNHSA